MLPMCSDQVRNRLQPVLARLHLPASADLDPDAVYRALLHDKKSNADGIAVVLADAIGSFRIVNLPYEALRERLKTVIRRNPA
jgi:3-dehydroquinate synthase